MFVYLKFFVVITLASLMNYQRMGTASHLMHYGRPLRKIVNRNAKLMCNYDCRKWTRFGEENSRPQYNHNRFLRSKFFDTSKYRTNRFKDEYLYSPQSNYQTSEGHHNHQERHFKRHARAQTNIKHFIPKVIPLMRQEFPSDNIKIKMCPTRWRTIETYPTSDSTHLRSLSRDVELNLKPIFKEDTVSPNTLYRTQQNLRNIRSRNFIPSKQKLPEKTFQLRHVNIPRPKEETKSDIIISKATSGRFNSGKFSVPYPVGVDEEPADTHVNKNSHNAGGSSGLRQSRLNHIAVVVSTSMTVKED